jgi:hypothetical protein
MITWTDEMAAGRWWVRLRTAMVLFGGKKVRCRDKSFG